MKNILLEIEENLQSRKQTDRIMWFSMWAVLSVASFGVAWFPMIYYLIKRRNTHFSRQQKLEELIMSRLKSPKPEKTVSEQSNSQSRSAAGWTVLTVLVVPAFYVFYFLKNDLYKHEEHEHEFLSEVTKIAEDSKVPLNIQGFVASPKITTGKYVALSVITCGLAAVYWLYRIFNEYNSHFQMQWMIEDELLRFVKEFDKKVS